MLYTLSWKMVILSWKCPGKIYFLGCGNHDLWILLLILVSGKAAYLPLHGADAVVTLKCHFYFIFKLYRIELGSKLVLLLLC